MVAAFSSPPLNRPVFSKVAEDSHVDDDKDPSQDDHGTEDKYTPWNHPNLSERSKGPKTFRSRQHVNPLASKFQKPTVLSPEWPKGVFENFTRPLFLDIGCSRGGFLLGMAKKRPNEYNYLGLEIRPIVVHQAKDRMKRSRLQGHLDFVGCNANVDLERLLTMLSQAKMEAEGFETQSVFDLDLQRACNLQMVCIQFPDPHFKARHAKRRVVTPELVQTLAKFMSPGATVFLQSDVQSVLDEMRLQFREQSQYFTDSIEAMDDYVEGNLFEIPTEREVTVLDRDLPVYRSTFTRNDEAVIDKST